MECSQSSLAAKLLPQRYAVVMSAELGLSCLVEIKKDFPDTYSCTYIHPLSRPLWGC